ncbi:MAG: hypothetical protein Q8R32_01805 [bacterium]|nr:hypothetical protein [bacterium]
MRTPTPKGAADFGGQRTKQAELRDQLPSRYVWRLRSEQPPQSIDELVSALLRSRGVGESAAASFLNPSL